MRTFVNWTMELNKVLINVLILGSTVRDLKGLNNLKVLKELTLPIFGKKLAIPVRTTMKSSQFQLSLK